MSTYSIILVIVFILLWIGIMFNKFYGLNGKMSTNWKEIEKNLKLRYQLFPLLVNMAKNQAKYDQNNLQALMTLYTQTSDPRITSKTQQELDAQATPLISNLLHHFQNYPTLSQNYEFVNLERSVVNIETQINNLKLNYNQFVVEYNQALNTTPSNIIGAIFRFERKPELVYTDLS